MKSSKYSTALRKRRQFQSGNALLELALSLPLLGLILVGAMDFGRLFYTQITVASAARAGARYGMQSITTSTDTTGMQNAVANDSTDVSGVTSTAAQICYCNNNGTQTTGNCGSTCPSGGLPDTYVQVTVQKTFTTLMNYPFIPSPVQVKQTATMRVEP